MLQLTKQTLVVTVVPQVTTASHHVKPESHSQESLVSVREKGEAILTPDVLTEGTGFDQLKQQQNDFAISIYASCLRFRFTHEWWVLTGSRIIKVKLAEQGNLSLYIATFAIHLPFS